MEENSIQKFYPTAEELSSVCTRVQCPQENCKALFQCSSNLNMHLIKHHKITHGGLTSKKSETQYFCPVLDCPYYKDSGKHFSKLKYLKQHFLKVHASKEFTCKKCGKKFSTEGFRTLHMKTCGEVFICKCGSQYTSSEAILTHVKRKGKGHEAIKNGPKEIKKPPISVRPNDCSMKKERYIYPKITSDMAFPIHYIAAVALSELSVPQTSSRAVDKGIQTEVQDVDCNKDYSAKFEKRKYSQQTQTTGRNKKIKISIQTQTNNDFLKRKSRGQSKGLVRKRKKSMETQTKEYIQICKNEGLTHPQVSIRNCVNKRGHHGDEKINLIEVISSKRGVDCADEEKARKWLWEMVSSTGKTSDLELMQYSSVPSKNNQIEYDSKEDSQVNQVFDLNRLCNIETQTDIDSFLIECNEDTNFTLCSTTETQTTDDFDSMLYTNMCTQTCEDVDQLFNFNFVHNETQTAWPDLNDCVD